MNKYEMVMIINSNITDKQKRLVINKIEEFIATNGKITKTDDLGIKKLAYEVKKHSTGHYYVIEFELENSKVLELERLCRIIEEILKFIVVRKDV